MFCLKKKSTLFFFFFLLIDKKCYHYKELRFEVPFYNHTAKPCALIIPLLCSHLEKPVTKLELSISIYMVANCKEYMYKLWLLIDFNNLMILIQNLRFFIEYSSLASISIISKDIVIA